MKILQSIILGLVQGLTEFLPVSSSGHLIVFKKLFGIDQAQFGLTFDIALHFATLIAVFIVFWPDILAILKKPVQKLTGLLIVATIPAVLVGLFLDDYIEKISQSGRFSGNRVSRDGCAPLLFAESQKTRKNDRNPFLYRRRGNRHRAGDRGHARNFSLGQYHERRTVSGRRKRRLAAFCVSDVDSRHTGFRRVRRQGYRLRAGSGRMGACNCRNDCGRRFRLFCGPLHAELLQKKKPECFCRVCCGLRRFDSGGPAILSKVLYRIFSIKKVSKEFKPSNG